MKQTLFQVPSVSSPSEESESELKNTNTSSHQIPPVVDDARSEEIIGKYNCIVLYCIFTLPRATVSELY